MDRLSKGLAYALIPTGIVYLLMTLIMIIVGFCAFLSIHIVTFEAMFSEPSVTEVINYYGELERTVTYSEFNLYPLFLCLFIDGSIFLGLCGFFNISVEKALLVILIIIAAPISIPCLIVCYFLNKKYQKTNFEKASFEKPKSKLSSSNMVLAPRHKKRR